MIVGTSTDSCGEICVPFVLLSLQDSQHTQFTIETHVRLLGICVSKDVAKNLRTETKGKNKGMTFSFVHIHFVMQTTLHNTQYSQAWHRASIRTVQMVCAVLMA